MERARERLRSAELLSAAGQRADAVSRAYYAVFHDGLRPLIGEHFVRPGTLAPEHGRTLSRMAADRNDAEYDVAAVFSEADVGGDLTQAAAFLSAVQTLLPGSEE